MAIAILQGIGGRVPQDKSIKIERDGSYTVKADEGYELEAVEIVVDTPDKKPEEELDLGVIKTNGAREITPSEGKVFNKVAFNVQVPPQGVEQFDERLDGIIALQNGYIGSGYKPSEGLEYSLDWQGNAYEVGIGSCADEVVVIPSEHDGYPVTVIGNDFTSKTMKVLVLPDTLTYVMSVNSCTALEKVIFGANFRSLLYWSFEGNVNCKVYDFSRCLQIPTIDLYDDPMYSVFSDMPDDCKMLVPPHLLDDWKRATNWIVFADHIVAAESVADNGTSDEVYNTTEERLEVIEGNVEKVYEAGSDTGFEAGKQAEYDAIWDGFQQNGQRTDYDSAFRFWTDTMFKPKYDFRPTTAIGMFQSSNIKDVAGALTGAGVALDFSACPNLRLAFYNCPQLETVPIIDTTATKDDSASGTLYYLFGNDVQLRTVEKIILKQSGTQAFNGTFSSCGELRDVRFEGVIGQNGLSLSGSPSLRKASIENIINCLSAETSGLSITLSKYSVNKAFETSYGSMDGTTSSEWQALIATKSNWTISLV